jgi:Mg2+ and Co2+ transporter CorA
MDHAIALARPVSGIIWAISFDARGQATALDIDRDPLVCPPGGWLWLHVALADARCRDWLARLPQLDEEARASLAAPEETLSLDMTATGFAGVIADIETDLDRGMAAIGRLRLALAGHVLITARRHALRCVETARQAVLSGALMPTPAHLVAEVAVAFAVSMGRIARDLETDLDRIEDLVIQAGSRGERQRLGNARRLIVECHRALGQSKHMFAGLAHQLAARAALPHAPVEEAGAELAAVDQEFVALNDRARLLQDEVGAKLTETTNRQVFLLSVLTATLMPPTLVTGFFGMNTQGLPFAESHHGTWFALVVAALAGAGAFWLLRRLTRVE